jgi:hypothetical protein
MRMERFCRVPLLDIVSLTIPLMPLELPFYHFLLRFRRRLFGFRSPERYAIFSGGSFRFQTRFRFANAFQVHDIAHTTSCSQMPHARKRFMPFGV